MDETNLKENTDGVTPRSADFSGETQRYPMDGNSNCTAWCRWETYRVYRDGQPGWDCRFIINATKTNQYPTYGQGRVQAGVKGHEEGTLEEKYIEIVAGETRTFYDQAVFVRAEAGADVNMIAYANILIPNAVSKGMEFTITAKRNLWGVYFDANGGSGAPDMIKRHWGEIVYIPTTVPYKSGYTFKGWTKSKGSATVDYKPSDPIGDDFDVTLYAVWSQNVVKTWSITYNANGGSNAPAKQTANVGQSITITYSKPTRTGYTFLGWSTWNESPQPEEAFTPGYSYRSDYDITLYAVWKQQTQTTQYSLSFNLQGGNGTFNTLYGNYGDRVQIPYKSPTRSGYSFLGWATSSYGSASYQPGEYFTLYQNSTLYAVWQKNQTSQYIVSFDLQGGTATGGIPDVIGSYGFTFSITMKKPYKSGYIFQGWATSSSGQAVYQPGDSYTIYGNATLYAVWESQGGGSGDYKLEFDLQGGTGSFPAMYGNKGATLVIPRTTPTKGNITFLGWAEQPGGQAIYNPGDFYTLQNDTILYAIWDNMSMDNWTITYDANGGTGAPSRQTAYMWTEIVITSKKPIRDGYQFLGWSLYRNATEAEYQPGQSISGWYDMILYAVWEESRPTYCIITFDGNGNGDSVFNVPGTHGGIMSGGRHTLPKNIPIRAGYIFMGWSTTSNGSAIYQPGELIIVNNDMTLYAIWKEKGKPKFTFSKSYDCTPHGIGAVEELVMNATVENPENQKIYYKICFVDDANGTVNDYAINSNGLTNMIETGIKSVTLTVPSDILIRSIKNCDSEKSFKIVICSNYDNNFDISNTTINKQIISIRLYYNKPVIQSLEVSHAPHNSAQLVGVVKLFSGFDNINIRGNGESVYLDNKPKIHGEDYGDDNRFEIGEENIIIRYVFNFNVNKISDAIHTFKLVIDDGFFKTEKTVDLGRLSSDENIYIYQNGTIEANGFLLLDSFRYKDEDVILFEPGGFVSVKSFKKISEGIYFCPKVLEAFGYTQRTGD